VAASTADEEEAEEEENICPGDSLNITWIPSI
jgi:hypothetical protein